jgi:6-phosphogluconolactonase (cycloisomerase 2 family)
MRSYALNTTLAVPIALSLALAACDRDSTGPSLESPSPAASSVESDAGGAVYTSTNGSSANAILAFRRAEDGTLTPIGSFPTGGRGTGGAVDPLASQYAVILSADHHLLFSVNAGSNDVTSFRVGDDGGLVLADRQSAGGTLPVSLAARSGLLYVLNAGDNTVTGLRVNPKGKLIAIPQGTRRLASGAGGASTLHFSADGRSLIVTERTANRLETLAVEASGRLGAPVVTASSGAVPFGFDVTDGGVAVVSEAGGTQATAPNSAVSSYAAGGGSGPSLVTGSIDAGGRAACWVVVTRDGTAFVANSASNAIASVRVNGDGTLALLDAAAGTTPSGATPIDIDLSAGDRFLYALEAGSGNIGVFAVDGATLTPGTAVPTGAAGASGLQGIAAF